MYKNLTKHFYKTKNRIKNMKYLYIGLILVSFLSTLIITPWIKRYLKRVGIITKDQHKSNKPAIPSSGGLAVLVGVLSGIFTLIFIRTFVYNSKTDLVFLLAGICALLVITIVGFIDDSIIRKDKEESQGLRQWQKPILTLAAAIPLMAVNSGTTEMLLPLIGHVDIGILYPLLFIPVGVIGAANMVNLLGGLNGMESGMGIIYMGSLGAYAIVNGRTIAAIIAIAAFGSLLAFYWFNKYPAKILPGDSLTYLLGGIIACIAILGNMEKACLIISVPFILEFLLKLRGKFKKKTCGYYKDGNIQSYYDQIYSIPHIWMKEGRYTEKQVVIFLILIEAVFSALIWFI